MKHASRSPRRILEAVLLGCSLWPLGCQDEVSGFLTCGQDVCGPRQQCIALDQGSTCACLPGYVGSACEICDSGYRRTGAGLCEPLPIDCDLNPEVCGDFGTCVRAEPEDRCDCDERYTGRICASCVSGFQDNDHDGTCEPTCARAELSCAAPKRCEDASGSARCECPVGFVGDECELCASGYRHNGTTCVPSCAGDPLECGPRQVCVDGEVGRECACAPGYIGASCSSCDLGYEQDPATGRCLQNCSSFGLSCGDHGSCDNDLGFAYCRCDVGYAGETCDACAEGFALDAGESCSFAAPAGFTLVAQVELSGQSALVALDPASGDVIEVARPGSPGVAGGVEPVHVFLTGGTAVSDFDVVSGTTTPLASGLGVQPALTLDPSRSRLNAVGDTAPYDLVAIDPGTGATTLVGPSGRVSVVDLAYDAANDRVLALGEGIHALDPTSGAATWVGDAPPATRGLAYDAGGALYALSATDLTDNEARLDACRASAEALGITGFGTGPGSVVEPEPDETAVSLAAFQPFLPEVVAYLGQGVDGGLRTITIDADTPDALLCLELREDTDLVIEAQARFHALIAYTVANAVSVDIAAGFVGGSEPSVHLGARLPDFTVGAGDDALVYTAAEWEELALPIDPRFYRPGPAVLHELDPVTFASLGRVVLPSGLLPSGSLSAWLLPP